MTLYVYALCAASARPGALRGLRGEPLRVARWGRFGAVVGRVDAAPRASLRSIRRHDAVVRRLAERIDAILPVRFGSTLADETAVARALRERGAPALRRALRAVAGRVQMTLRVAEPRSTARVAKASATAVTSRSPRAASSRPGAAYLARLARDGAGARIHPAIATAGRALAPLVAVAVAERRPSPPWVATVHHLVARGDARRYASAVRSLAREDREHLYRVSGPWPPYAFAAGPPESRR